MSLYVVLNDDGTVGLLTRHLPDAIRYARGRKVAGYVRGPIIRELTRAERAEARRWTRELARRERIRLQGKG